MVKHERHHKTSKSWLRLLDKLCPDKHYPNTKSLNFHQCNAWLTTTTRTSARSVTMPCATSLLCWNMFVSATNRPLPVLRFRDAKCGNLEESWGRIWVAETQHAITLLTGVNVTAELAKSIPKWTRLSSTKFRLFISREFVWKFFVDLNSLEICIPVNGLQNVGF